MNVAAESSFLPADVEVLSQPVILPHLEGQIITGQELEGEPEVCLGNELDAPVLKAPVVHLDVVTRGKQFLIL